MKEKYTKPEVNVLMNVIINSDEQNNGNNVFFNAGDIIGSMVPGDGGDIFD